MKYQRTDRTIRVGDEVLYAGSPGVIVFIIDDDSYSDAFKKEHWSYLDKGFGMELRDGTLYHFDTPDEDLEPLS
jgi:hypothetical protein